MKKISILTATRAEFGQLKPLILKLMAEKEFETEVLVTGMHLSPDFGNTYLEIEAEGIPIAKKIKCLSEETSQTSVCKTMASAMVQFNEYFVQNKPDLLIIAGDRYETLAVCIAAMNAQIPIAHLHGGETTEGAIDEAIRHSITKMSCLHFTSCDTYRKRVIQLGEQPERVFNVGALSIENIINIPFLSKKELENDLNFKLSEKYAVVTFHPVTLDENSGIEQFKELLKAIDEFPEISFIFTKANADAGGQIINQMIDEYANSHSNVISVTSLGVKRYLSAVKHSAVVIGNSSSGIHEAPGLHVPTVNIGNRQKGRIMSKSVLNCKPEKNEIIKQIKFALSEEFKKDTNRFDNPFGDGHTSEKIVEILKTTLNKINIKKQFYDIQFDV